MQQSFTEMKSDVVNQLKSEYEVAAFERYKSEMEIELLGKQKNQTQQIIDLQLKSYESSGADFEEILRLQQSLLKYEINKTSALKEYHIAEAKLMYLIANDI
jgi:outer membrane protein TolC